MPLTEIRIVMSARHEQGHNIIKPRAEQVRSLSRRMIDGTTRPTCSSTADVA